MSERIILLVEDNPDDVALTKRAFTKNNVACKIVVARDGEEALDWLFCTGPFAGRDAGEAPAVVLLDLKLPKIDGLEVLHKIRQDPRTATLPVVILTSSKAQEDVMQSYMNGSNSYIRKPVDFTSFSEMARQLGVYWLLLNEAPHK